MNDAIGFRVAMRDATTPTTNHSKTRCRCRSGTSTCWRTGRRWRAAQARRRRRGSALSSRSPGRRTGRARRLPPTPARRDDAGRAAVRAGESSSGTTADLRGRGRSWVTGGGTPARAERPARRQSLRRRHGRRGGWSDRCRRARSRGGESGSPRVSPPSPFSSPSSWRWVPGVVRRPRCSSSPRRRSP